MGGYSQKVPGRAGDEYRMRMDTLTKSNKAIKEYCDEQNKEFRNLNMEDFGDMKLVKLKLATRFTESWYKHISDYFPPRSNKKSRKQGPGSLLENEVDFGSSASTSGKRGPLGVKFHNPDAGSKKNGENNS